MFQNSYQGSSSIELLSAQGKLFFQGNENIHGDKEGLRPEI